MKKTAHPRYEFVFIMAGLIGFFIHSMTYDSLRFPNLNWIFHSILGVMLALANSYQETSEPNKT